MVLSGVTIALSMLPASVIEKKNGLQSAITVSPDFEIFRKELGATRLIFHNISSGEAFALSGNRTIVLLPRSH